jgi:hypothetical protein
MKRKFWLLFQPAMVCLLFACAIGDADWQKEVPGTYTTYYQQAYSTGWDTLMIQPISQQVQDQYYLIRKTTYQRTGERSAGQQWLRAQRFICNWNKDKHTLTATVTGRVYHYDSQLRTIRQGNTIYQKLK